MMKIVQIVCHSLSTVRLIHLFTFSWGDNKCFLVNSSILCHRFDINRNYFIRNIYFINGKKSLCRSLNSQLIVMVYKKRIRCLKILSKTSNNVHDSHIIFHQLILPDQKLFSIKELKICSWPYKRINFPIFSQPSLKSFSTVKLFSQVK